jgi:FkbM family methyltransferase
MKNMIKKLPFKIRFIISSGFPRIYGGFYRLVYRPKPQTLSAYLHAYSKYRKGRVRVIQIGANDGITHDPIHKFIRRDGWSGVLLEPQKYVYNRFLAPLYANTKEIIPVNAAIGHKDGVLPIYNVGFTQERWANGLTSFHKDTLQKMIDSGYVAKQSKRYGIKVPDNPNNWIAEEMVNVICFETLVNMYQLKDVNMIVIDAEGFDDQIIQMIDFDLIRPDVLVFEAMHLDEIQHQLLCTFLEQAAYRVFKLGACSMALQKGLPL